ncbi:UPF0755 protein [Methylomarinovum caldicuralii]|uniref:Endolytic murein transglycosylase n=1 Tax=Methylomarinovum caldicuralii TaxID=438856 RepID=A0AAU9C3L3_9GAMM|nr:endolytic transglycosylase MltG [Methylomarinovum caldicuralii]BCX82273.1 UPF0755 protein [Methylomarinovum caldicuralii]
MKRLMLGLALLGLVTAGGAAWVWHSYRQALDRPLALERPLRFEVRHGESLRSVAERLHREGVLPQPRWLLWWARQRGEAAAVRAGEYRLTPGLTPKSLLALLVSGRVVQHRVTLVEGWTVQQALQALVAEPALRHTLNDVPLSRLLAELGLPPGHPEGRFFPDTYFFTRGASDRDILRRAYRRMEQVLAEAWAGRASGLPLKTPYEALILASIVEKETARRDEMPKIAGVFIRRLEKGMKLQTDPTVIYGLGAKFGGNLRRRDLETNTPYNTYVHPGLPPTPIALPGRAAIEAALHPAAGKALYFVAKGDGSHYFSATLRQHNRAVARYQLGRR